MDGEQGDDRSGLRMGTPSKRHMRVGPSPVVSTSSNGSGMMSNSGKQADHHHHQALNEDWIKIQRRTRRLTWSLGFLVAALACMSPFITIHLSQRIGLLLFESDLIQLRSSLYSVITCFLVLVILHSIVSAMNKHNGSSSSTNLNLQRILRPLIGSSAIVSAISYLAIALLVPHIKQIQRVPLATFDCNANLITIENCHQQFVSKGGEQGLFESASELLAGDLNGTNERLIKKLNCLKYNDKDLETLEVPTRFLLHKCGLVCKPQRQQLHQFGDDLNREQQQANNQPIEESLLSTSSLVQAATTSTTNVDGSVRQATLTKLVPPYADLQGSKDKEPAVSGGFGPESSIDSGGIRHYVYRNSSVQSSSDYPSTLARSDFVSSATLGETLSNNGEQVSANTNQLSLKICFSEGEFSGGSNYKQFCITNLANSNALSSNSRGQDQTLTVGQLNAMLRKQATQHQQQDDHSQSSSSLWPSDNFASHQDTSEINAASSSSSKAERLRHEPMVDQGTHYVNPVVQFESHFKNWPHLTRINLANSGETISIEDYRSADYADDEQANWCKFRPIPPFIVNNKPFSDIQCSVEHEYTMTTGPALDSINFSGRGADKIYLKKSSSIKDGENFARERCNIQCKVNILYQVRMNLNNRNSQKERRTTSSRSNNHHYDDQQENDQQTTKDSITSTGSRILNGLDHFYLPLKPCVIASGNKLKTLNYYMLFRTLGDSTLILSFILLNAFLILESIDRQQSQMEAEKYRLVFILLALTLVPILVSLSFDLISTHISPYYYANKDTKLSLFIRELPSNLMDYLMSLFSSIGGQHNNSIKRQRQQFSQQESIQQLPSINRTTSTDRNKSEEKSLESPEVSLQFVDNFMLPFFAYAVFMFALAINSLAIPLISTAPSLIIYSASSAEELGLVPTSHTQRSQSKLTQDKKSKSDDKSKMITATKLLGLSNRKHFQRKQALKMTLFLIVALFMGVQFNLSRLTQTQIIIESFGNPGLSAGQSSYSALWFMLSTHSTASIVALLLAFLLADETVTFFANFSPIRRTISASLRTKTQQQHRFKSTEDRNKRDRANLIKCLALSLLVYSIRHFALANLSTEMHFKWLLVFLYQVAELFNFPLTWLALSARAHQILTEYMALFGEQHRQTFDENGSNNKRPPPATNGQSSKRNSTITTTKQHLSTLNSRLNSVCSVKGGGRRGEFTKALNIHVIIQSSLALTYFAVARAIALFAHSLYISLHLYSDNVDWFITSFYRTPIANAESISMVTTTTLANNNHLKQHAAADSGNLTRLANPQANIAAAAGHLSSQANSRPPDSLFSPLPSERQTYLHASRLFLKYNSLVCFLIAAALLLNLIFVKYQTWAEQKRTLDVNHPDSTPQPGASRTTSSQALRTAATSDAQSDLLIDERLSLDLMQINSPNTMRIIHPKPTASTAKQLEVGHDSNNSLGPRAKILFHYDLGQRTGSSEDDETSAQACAGTKTGAGTKKGEKSPTSTEVVIDLPQAAIANVNEIRIPIGFDESAEDQTHQAGSSASAKGSAYHLADHREPRANESFERIVRHRNKKVRIFDDGETWPEAEEPSLDETAQVEAAKAQAQERRAATVAAGAASVGNPQSRSHSQRRHDNKTRFEPVSCEEPVVYARSIKKLGKNDLAKSKPSQTTTRTTTITTSRSSSTRKIETRLVQEDASSSSKATTCTKPKRSITFAPTTTLIGSIRPLSPISHRGRVAVNQQQQQQQHHRQQSRSSSGSSGSIAQRASPEPSIGNEEEDDNELEEEPEAVAERAPSCGVRRSHHNQHRQQHDDDSIENDGAHTDSINHNDLN